MTNDEDAIELEDVYVGDLDGPTFEALFDDLSTQAEVLSVRTKAGSQTMSEAAIDLDRARLLLLLGKVGGVQIRYLHAREEWLDTIACAGGALRLVRMRVPERVVASDGRVRRQLRVLG